MQYPADVKAAIPAILTDAGPAPEKGPGAPVNAVYVKYGVAPSCAETNPVHPPPAAEWLDLVDASYEIF